MRRAPQDISRHILMLLCILMTSCSYALKGANTTFTSTNVMKLRIGMTTTEVVALFGAPDRIERSTCGGKTPSGPWPCIMWEYDVEQSYDGGLATMKTNTVTFDANFDPPKLNNWTIERMW